MAAKYIRFMVVAGVSVLVASSRSLAAIFFTKDIAPTPGNTLLPLCPKPTSLVPWLTAALTFSGTMHRRSSEDSEFGTVGK